MDARRGRSASLPALLCAGLLSAFAAPAEAQLAPRVFVDVDGQPLAFQYDDEILSFLRDAEIVSRSRFEEEGVDTRRFDASGFRGDGYRMILEHDGVRVHATFRTIDQQTPVATFEDGSTRVHFRDFALFECAAYELARLLGVSHVAPAVERRVDGQRGSLQLDVAGAITESERLAEERADPSQARWNMQLATMNVFDTLIANADRTRHNLLYDPYWRVWLTDHTRAFGVERRARLDALQAVESRLWEKLETVPDQAIDEALSSYLTSGELHALLERRRQLVDHFRGLIAERGRRRVVYSY